jgi:hypothetical protein
MGYGLEDCDTISGGGKEFLSLALSLSLSLSLNVQTGLISSEHLGGKSAECDADQFPPSSAEVKYYGAIPLSPSPHFLSWESAYLYN